jgi:hypothetical protein
MDHGLILENPRGLSEKSAKSGPWVDFLTDNSWTGRERSVHHGPTPAWTNGHGGALTEARPPAAPVRQSSPAGVENGERGTRSSSRGSPGLERRRGGRATTGKARWCRRSVRGRLELGGREMRAGKGAVKLEEVARLL